MKKIFSALFLCLFINLTAVEITSWSSPTTISTSGVNSSSPTIAMDPNGNLVGIWVENNAIIAKIQLLNSSWSSRTMLSSTTASSPQLVVDPNGNATAVWVESGVINTATLPFGSSWSSVTTLSGSGSSSPQIAVDPSGDVIAIWVTNGFVQSKTKLFNSSWQLLPDVLSASGSANPQISIGSNNRVVAVWQTLNGITSTYNVNAATRLVSGAWGAAQLVSNPSQNSINPKVAVNSSGHAISSWHSYDVASSVYSDVVVQASIMPTVNSWTTPVNVSGFGIYNPTFLMSEVRLSDTDNGIAVWTNSYDGSTFTIESSNGTMGNIWSAPTTIISDFYAYSVDFTLNASADALALYMAGTSNSTPILVQYAQSHAGGASEGSWTTPVAISSGNVDGFPKIATTINGSDAYVGAIWTHFDGSNNVIQSAFGTGSIIMPPSNVSVVQNSNNFGLFTEFFNHITWMASSDPMLAGYVVYRNGNPISSLPAATLSYDDDNAIQNGPVTYGVTAFNFAGQESAMIVVPFP